MMAVVLFGLFCTAAVSFAIASFLARPAPAGTPHWTLWAAAIAAGCAISCMPRAIG